MIDRTAELAVALTVLLAVGWMGLASCGDEEGSNLIDALVIVQETNLGSCVDGSVVYERQVHRECTDRDVEVLVCASTELCEAQIEDLTATVRRCEDQSGTFRASTQADCGD